MRRHHKVLEAFGDEARNLSERLGGDQLAAQLACDRDRYFHSFGFHPPLDPAEARRDTLHRYLDFFERERGATVAFGLGFALAGVVAVAIGARLGGRDFLRDFCRRGPLTGLVGRGEVGVEQEFRACGHQYTNSSSARFLVSVISPLAARSFARLTSSACA